jgi:hypothetical protein
VGGNAWPLTVAALAGAAVLAAAKFAQPQSIQESAIATAPCSVRSVRGDFNGDGKTDVVWRNSATGQNHMFFMNGRSIVGEASLRTVPARAWRIAGVGDFNGDGRADILWRNADSGQNYLYLMQGAVIVGEGYLHSIANLNWHVAGVGDFDGDGCDDILWRNAATGQNYVYFMNGLSIANEGYLRTVPARWEIAGIGDFNGDGRADILWRNADSGQNYLYLMQGPNIVGEGYLRTIANLNWRVAGIGDFDGDGCDDILWRNAATGQNYVYFMNALFIVNEGYLRTVGDLAWHIAAVGYYDDDGNADILWRNSSSGDNYLHFMNGTAVKPNEGYTRTVAAPDWRPVASLSGTPPPGVFPLRVQPGKRHLIDASGAPFLMIGESPQALIGNLSEADAELFLANRKSHGFNTIWVNLLCANGTGCFPNGWTHDGIKPFTSGLDLSTFDLSTPNEAYFARADRMIQLAAKYGFLVILDPAETISWLDVLRNNGLAKARTYGRYLGTRYKHFPNIVWMSGNDFQWRDPNKTTPSDVPLVQAVATGIKETAPNQIQTALLDFNVSSSLDDASWAPIISLNAVYTYFPTYAKVLDARSQSASMPVFLAEANYEFEDNTGQEGGPSTPVILRRQEYWSLLSGASGQLYGNAFTWGFKSGWQSQLNTPGAVQMAHLKVLFEPRPWHELVPDMAHVVVTGGLGTFSSDGSIGRNGYVTAARTPNGRLVMAYVPSGRTVTVNMSQLSGPVTARWYDPTTGVYTSIAGSPFANIGSQAFDTPGVNGGGDPNWDQDWVLVLEAQ